MSFTEFIGFVITSMALLFIIFRSAIEKWRSNGRTPEEMEKAKERDERLKNFLNSLNMEMKTPIPPPVPSRKKEIKKTPLPSNPDIVVESKKPEKKTAARAMAHQKPSFVKHLVRNLPNKKQMIILHDVIDRPKAYERGYTTYGN